MKDTQAESCEKGRFCGNLEIRDFAAFPLPSPTANSNFEAILKGSGQLILGKACRFRIFFLARFLRLNRNCNWIDFHSKNLSHRALRQKVGQGFIRL